jgi:hypothetical protein
MEISCDLRKSSLEGRRELFQPLFEVEDILLESDVEDARIVDGFETVSFYP